MAFRLTITDTRNPAGTHQRGFVQPRVVLGRSRICDVCLPDLTVSSLHAEIRIDSGQYHLVDLGSMNGTLLGDRPLIAHRPRRLQPGETISIAQYRIDFAPGSFAGTAPCKDEAMKQARDMLRAILARQGALSPIPVVVALSGPGRGARYAFVNDGDVAIIGRAREHALRIEHPDISRLHAEIRFEDGVIHVRDLGSRNGTRVGGQRMDAFVLEPGVTFTAGQTVFGLENPVDPALLAIQNAPEEDTSSFFENVPGALGPPTQPLISVEEIMSTHAASGAETADVPPTADADVIPTPPLPIGPTDPLIPDDAPRSAPLPRVSSSPETGTEIGLIVIGALIVLASVAGLIWLLT